MRIILRMINETFTQTVFKCGFSKSYNNRKNYEYKEAIEALNTLQTNASVLQALKKENLKGPQNKQMENTIKFLKRTGVTIDQLENKLSVIHVSGTKGKGSTCAFCESILRNHGFKTGFFSSPHLIAARERIRINGKPLTESEFTKYFWDVYQKLIARKENENDMPPYFNFFTVMAFNVFLQEKVDVAVIEVGIGGEYDCTNILNKVPVVGISSLGLDHTSILGDTIEKIAWQKSGIMKAGAVAFTASEQLPSALQVLQQRAKEKNCLLFEAPPLENYNWLGRKIDLGLQGRVQRLNASLALQLTNAWLHKRNAKENDTAVEERIRRASTGFAIDNATYLGLKHCKWPGRNQIIECKMSWCTNTFFLDGAHTLESIQQCVDWFLQASESIRVKSHRTLLFNATGDRDDALLMGPFFKCHFDTVLFCPNLASKQLASSSDRNRKTEPQLNCSKNNTAIWKNVEKNEGGYKEMHVAMYPLVLDALTYLERIREGRQLLVPDQKNFNVTTEELLNRCKNNINIWKNLEKSKGSFRAKHVAMHPSVMDALTSIENKQQEQHILVTGSLHLIGAVLSILDPDLTISYS